MATMRILGLAAVAMTAAGAASAAEQCGAQIHMRYGETRAYFQHALAACRPDGYCSVVVALPAPNDEVVQGNGLRIARSSRGAPYAIELTASAPFNADDGQPMSLAFGRHVVDLAGKAPLIENSLNLFGITDPATVADIVAHARRAATLRWSYRTESGPAAVWMALGGLTLALAWVDCMSARTGVPIGGRTGTRNASYEAAQIDGLRNGQTTNGQTTLHPGQTLAVALPGNGTTG